MINVENLTKVHLAFENCEGIDIPAEDIRYFHATEITATLRFNNIRKKSPIRKEQYMGAGYFRIMVADKPEYARILAWNDIAQVHVYDDKGNTDWFFVKWGDDQYNNEYQKSHIYRGEIDVTISEAADEND
ncbi:hypothetical protein [Mesobacillus zeae]|uniref:Uncharacterized protein n=1 Tax=Mesobacillus zeae TaxID=1917180 RepID=A0A398BG13_9BACI|nr:hypothetical protein [Mesobacillus zeae]RID89002.1 hypothetical protein D1970_00430 [Mesobacillus zeae]